MRESHPPVAPEGTRFLPEVAASVGITYRQAHTWVTKGYATAKVAHRCDNGLAIDSDADPCHPGSGHLRVLDDQDVALLQLLARLVKIGFTVEAAGRLARSLSASDSITLGEGFTLERG